MSIYRYTQNAGNIANELRESVSREDAVALRADLRQMGLAAWLTWVAENQKTAFSVLRATPEARSKRKLWADPIQRSRICLAAFHLARLGELVLSSAAPLQPGGSYRGTCEAAAYACLHIVREARWIWPFESVPPFDEWRQEGMLYDDDSCDFCDCDTA